MVSTENEDPKFSLQTLLDLKASLDNAKKPPSTYRGKLEPLQDSNRSDQVIPCKPQVAVKYALKGLKNKSVKSDVKHIKLCLNVARTGIKRLYELKKAPDQSLSNQHDYTAERLHSSFILTLIESDMVCISK